MKTYYDQDIHYWFCENCDRRWQNNPDITHCTECGNEEIEARVLSFTREDALVARAEKQGESFREDNN